MEERIKRSLLTLGGENIQVEESKKSKENRRKKTFLYTIEDLKYNLNRSDSLDREYGINLLSFEDRYFKIIENLIIEQWGISIAEVIFWWIYDVKNPKENDYYIFEKSLEKKFIIKTPIQLYNTLKKLKLFKPI